MKIILDIDDMALEKSTVCDESGNEIGRIERLQTECQSDYRPLCKMEVVIYDLPAMFEVAKNDAKVKEVIRKLGEI